MSQNRRTPDDEPFFLVRTVSARTAAGHDTGRHVHPLGQLIYCSAGVITVWTPAGSWVAPPRWAIWAPAGVRHSIRFAGAAELRTLYLRADVASCLPAECAVMAVSPVLRELVLKCVELGMLDEREPAHCAMAIVIGAELSRRDTAPLTLPAPTSVAARAAAEMMTAAPGEGAGFGTPALARRVGLSARTLERRFCAETGMTLAAWGRQARLLGSLRALAAGAQVKTAAAGAGFRTASAFVAAFRAAFGRTPGAYFS